MVENNKLKANIELNGFREIDSSSMEMVRKNVDNHVRRLLELCKNMENLHVTLKKLHQREKSEIYNIHARLRDGGKIYVSHSEDRNLLIALDKALEKLANELD